MVSEFNIIQQYFTRPAKHVDLGVGDDATMDVQAKWMLKREYLLTNFLKK